MDEKAESLVQDLKELGYDGPLQGSDLTFWVQLHLEPVQGFLSWLHSQARRKRQLRRIHDGNGTICTKAYPRGLHQAIDRLTKVSQVVQDQIALAQARQEELRELVQDVEQELADAKEMLKEEGAKHEQALVHFREGLEQVLGGENSVCQLLQKRSTGLQGQVEYMDTLQQEMRAQLTFVEKNEFEFTKAPSEKTQSLLHDLAQAKLLYAVECMEVTSLRAQIKEEEKEKEQHGSLENHPNNNNDALSSVSLLELKKHEDNITHALQSLKKLCTTIANQVPLVNAKDLLEYTQKETNLRRGIVQVCHDGLHEQDLVLEQLKVRVEQELSMLDRTTSYLAHDLSDVLAPREESVMELHHPYRSEHLNLHERFERRRENVLEPKILAEKLKTIRERNRTLEKENLAINEVERRCGTTIRKIDAECVNLTNQLVDAKTRFKRLCETAQTDYLERNQFLRFYEEFIQELK